MTAKEVNISKLLEGKKEFTIPIYQRHYTWGKRQVLTLLEDIDTIVESLSNNKNVKPVEHFLGSIVLLEVSARNSAVQKYSVVDGQQRLTTIFLYIIALYKILKEELEIQKTKHIDTKDEDFISFCEDWLPTLKGYVFNRSSCKLYSAIEDHKEFFKDIFSDKNINNYKESLLYRNYSIIFSLLKAKITDNKYSNLQYSVGSLSNLITVEVLLKEGEDDPQKVFESLNSTGLGLDQIELIRNYVLMKFPSRQDYIYTTYWEPIIKNVTLDGKVYAQELFYVIFQLYLSGAYQKSSSREFKSLYTKYKKELSQKSEEEIEEVLIYLKEYSEFILNILALKDFEDEHLTKCIHLSLSTSGLPNLVPFYSKIYCSYTKNLISKKDLDLIFSEMSNYVVIRAMLKDLAHRQPPTAFFIGNKVLQYIIKNEKNISEVNIINVLYKEIAKDNLLHGHNITTERFESFLQTSNIMSFTTFISAILAFVELGDTFYKEVSSNTSKDKLTAIKLIDSKLMQKHQLYHLSEQQDKIGNYLLTKSLNRKNLEKDTSYKKYKVNKYLDFDLKEVSKYNKELVELRSRFLSQEIVKVININDNRINYYTQEASNFILFIEIGKELASKITTLSIKESSSSKITNCEYYTDVYRTIINYLYDKYNSNLSQTSIVSNLKLRHKTHISDLNSPEKFKNSSDLYYEAGSTSYHLRLIEVIKELKEEDNILVQLG